jgi:hypothetical protein
MKKFLILIAMWGSIQILSAQTEKLTLLTDKVELRLQPAEDAPVLDSAYQAESMQGRYVNPQWFEVTTETGKKAYLTSWEAVSEKEAEMLAKRITPSASTLFRMMRFFRQTNRSDKAEEFAIRIINSHNEEEYPSEDKACFKLGHMAYIEIISDPETGVRYDLPTFGFTQRVMSETDNPTVLAMAHYHQARYLAQNGQVNLAEERLLEIVRSYPQAVARNECKPEEVDSWFYRPERAKRLFCALALIQTGEDLKRTQEKLRRIIEEGDEASQAMAQELYDNLGSLPYPKDDSIWY